MTGSIEEALRQRYEDAFTDAQFEAVNQLLNNKVDLQNVSSQEVDLEKGPERAVKVKIREGTFFADPDSEYCAVHGTKGDQTPPEGRTTDGQGNSQYGVR